MPVDINKVEIFLKDADSKESFWVNNGPVVRNVYELVSALKNMDDAKFAHHVHDDKNDFSDWVRNVLKDIKLADSLLKEKDKDSAIREIQSRISFMEKQLDKLRKTQVIKGKIIEKAYLELVISFILGLVVGMALGILIEHYALIPRGWF